jgi:hypothetical protein
MIFLLVVKVMPIDSKHVRRKEIIEPYLMRLFGCRSELSFSDTELAESLCME